jgi:hypothetical protein
LYRRLALFFILFGLLSSFLVFQVFAQEDEVEHEKAVAVSLILDREQVSMGDTIGIKAKIDNLSNVKVEVSKTDVDLEVPEGWKVTSSPSDTLTIPSSSSIFASFSVKVPEDIPEGRYTVFINTVAIDENGKAYAAVGQLEVTTLLKKSINLANIRWEDITLLMLIYTIPSTAIERIVEAMKGLRRGGLLSKWLKDEATVKGLDATLKKIEGETEDITKSNFLTRYTYYHEKKIHEESENRGRAYLFASLWAIAPAIFLTYYGIGLLQVLGYQSDPSVFFFDAFTAIVAITFLTSPSHEIISILEKLRKYKTGGTATAQS